MQIIFQDQRMEVAAVTPNAEMHGDRPETVCSVKLEAHVPNEFLDKLSAGLKAALYELRAGEQRDLADEGRAGDPSFLPSLRFQDYEIVVRSKDPMPGARVTIGQPGDVAPIELSPCRIDKLVVDRLEGGSVAISFMVHAHPEAEQIGALGVLVRREVVVTVRQPEEPTS